MSNQPMQWTRDEALRCGQSSWREPLIEAVLRNRMQLKSREELLAYAKHQVANASSWQHTLLCFLLGLGGLGMLVTMLIQDASSIADRNFLRGFAYGVLLLPIAVATALQLVLLVRRQPPIGHQALRRLIALEQQEAGEQTDAADSR
jgi:hypothetical protein